MNPMDEAAEALYEHADRVAFNQQEHGVVDEHRRSTRVVLAGFLAAASRDEVFIARLAQLGSTDIATARRVLGSVLAAS